jgi:hypothetical protein
MKKPPRHASSAALNAGSNRPSVQRFCQGAAAQPFNFVLQQEFFALQLNHFQIVEGGMANGILNLAFDSPVPFLKFGEMGLQGHSDASFRAVSDGSSVPQRGRGVEGQTCCAAACASSPPLSIGRSGNRFAEKIIRKTNSSGAGSIQSEAIPL